ncbi:uncharacterized protein isoform X2 [Leptinotarsa decemlineata]|uniref:uncharacterized protein isoform X2 n=1 Tax=Leptinotarsa decemlineata TaxID=7539 RepID=UPI003D3056EB
MDNTDENHFLVVEFPEEKNSDGIIPMAIISSNWTFARNGNMFCYWPSYLRSDKEKEKLIKAHSDLQEDKSMECAIVVKFSTVDYERATTKLHRLEEASQTESDLDHEHNKRKLKKKHFSDYEPDFIDSDEENIIPKIPQPKKNTKFLTSASYDNNNNSQSQTSCMRASNNPAFTNLVTESNAQNSIEKNKQPNSQSMQISLKSSLYQDNTVGNSESKACQENKALIVEVLRQLENIKIDIKHLILNSKIENSQPLPEQLCVIDSIEDLQEFNTHLEDEDFFSKACSQFQIFGGKDGPETVRKIMSQLITHKVALQMNWSGRNNKQGFNSLKKIITLIHAVAPLRMITLRNRNLCELRINEVLPFNV